MSSKILKQIEENNKKNAELLKKLNEEVAKKKSTKKKSNKKKIIGKHDIDHPNYKEPTWLKHAKAYFNSLIIKKKDKEFLQELLEERLDKTKNDEYLIYDLTEYPEFDKDLFIVRSLAKLYDISKYIDKNTGKLNEKFMKKVDLDFYFKNGKNLTAEIAYNPNDNIETEIFLLNAVSGNYKIIPKKYNYLTTEIRDLTNSQFMQGVLASALLDNIDKTTRPFTLNKKGVVLKYQNPLNTQHRLINTTGRTYKQIFKKIRLKEVKFDDVNIDYIDYNISKNCVRSYFTTTYGKDNVKKYLKSDEPDTDEIFEFAKEINLNIDVYNQNRDLIDSYECKDSEYKKLSYFIHNTHMYVFNPEDEKKQEPILYNKDTFEEDKDKKIYITDKKIYNKLLKEHKKKYSMLQYNSMSFPTKDNCTVVFDPLFKEKKDVLDDFKYNSDSIYNCIEKQLELKGYLNEETLESVRGYKIIRYYKTNFEDDVRFDMNSSYLYPLYRDRVFPVPSVNDYWEKYKESDKIVDHYFYKCTFKYYDKIIHPSNDMIYGEVLKFIIKKGGILKKIISVLKITNTISIGKEYLPNKILTEENEHKHFPKKFIIHYIGWLQSLTSESTKYSDIKNLDEAQALIDQYETSSAYTNVSSYMKQKDEDYDIKDEDYDIKEDNVLCTFKHTIITNKFSNGLLAAYAIKSLINIRLYEFNEQFLIDNPKAILNSIHTDSLGYRLKEKIKDKELLYQKLSFNMESEYINKNKIGKFKIEKFNFFSNKDEFKESLSNYEKMYYEMYESNYEPREIKDREELKINYQDSSKYKEMIKNNKSFQLEAPAGFGKSYFVENYILKELEEEDYILTSTVIHNCQQFKNCVTLQSLLHMKNNEQLINQFKDKKYLIIDEAVQLTQYNMLQLEFIKSNTKCKFIMLSDFNQCIVDNYNGQAFIETYFCHKLMDFNVLNIKKHKNIRYDNELYEILTKVIILKDDILALRKFVIKSFKNKSKDKACELLTTINLCYTNNYRKKEGFHCSTVHKMQGKTIKNKFQIHEINKMDFRLIYTAISRATTKDQITIII